MWDLLPSFLQELSREQLDQALPLFQSVEVEPGFRLMEEGEDDASLVLVLTGELMVSTGGTRLALVHGGDVVGEMALFGQGMRTATVDAVTHSRLLLLDAEGYHSLRAIGNVVAAVLEDHALRSLVARLGKTSSRIAELSRGAGQSLHPGAGFFDRVASAFGSGGLLFPGMVDGATILARSPLFEGVPRPVLEEVAACFYPVAARRGQFLCTQGETGNDMFVIGSGLVDVVIALPDDKVQHLATLEAGEAFGMCALLQPDQRRMASCVASEKIVALSMGRIKWAETTNRSDLVGSVLRVAMIRSLADQLAYANGQLSMLDIRRQRREAADPSATVEFIRNATAALEAHGGLVSDGQGQSSPWLGEP